MNVYYTSIIYIKKKNNNYCFLFLIPKKKKIKYSIIFYSNLNKIMDKLEEKLEIKFPLE